jgi:hypothetical protein
MLKLLLASYCVHVDSGTVTMGRVLLSVGLAGGFFIAWQLWGNYKGQRSLARIAHEKAYGPSTVTLPQYLAEREIAMGAPKRLLNVNNFGLAELEVCFKQGTRNASHRSLSILNSHPQ